MGHLVNPISLRLGRTQLWRSQWYKSTASDYISTLKEDFAVYQYIESFFKYSQLIKKRRNTLAKIKAQYSFKNQKQNYKMKMKSKNKRFQYLRPSKRRRVRIKRYATSNMVKKLSLIFSHANIIRTSSNLIINMHIYDGALETFNAKQESTSSFLSLIDTSSIISKAKLAAKNVNKKFSNNSFFKNNNDKYKSFTSRRPNSFSFKNKTLDLFSALTSGNRIDSMSENNNSINKFVKNRFRYKPYITKISTKNTNRIRHQFILKSKIKCNFIRSSKFISWKPKLSKKESALVMNLELRFINSRIKYLLNSFFKLNGIFPREKLKTKKKNLKYYFRLVKLLYLLFIKRFYKNRLQNIFILRLLSYTIFRLRLLIGKKLQRTKLLVKRSKRNSSNKYDNYTFSFNKKINFKSANFTDHTYDNKHININNKRQFSKKIKDRYTKKKQKSFRINVKERESALQIKNYNKSIRFRLTRIKKSISLFTINYLKLSKLFLYVIALSSQYVIENNKLELYKTRFRIWFFVSRVLFENLRTLVRKNTYSKVKLNYFGLNNKTPTAAMLVNYITNKLYQKYTIFETLKPLTRDLSSNFTIEGFKISCAGRLTKKERASVFVQQDKKVPANTLDSFIDYATSIARLRHGVCGLKVWVTRKKTYKAFTYNFSYTYPL